MVQTASSALSSVGTGEGDVLPLLRPPDFVAPAFHKDDEVSLAPAFLHGVADVVHQTELPALALLCGTPFSGRQLLAAAFVLWQDTEPVCLADFIADQPQRLQRVGILPELPPGFKAHGVDDQVTMDMVGVAVGGDEDFRTGPGSDCKLLCNLVSLPGRDVLREFEGLHILIEVNAVHLSVSCLGGFELQNGIPTFTVDAADELLPGLLVPGFIFSHAISHHCPHGTEVLSGFLDVGYGCHGTPRLIRYSSS